MRTRRIVLADIELEVAEAGDGGRPILLVHGFCGAKEDFTPFLDLLAALGWHAVAPDQRGHGASSQPRGEAAYSLDRFAADVLALADGLGWDRFTLLGHSMGGMIAQVVAVAAGHRLDGLILMDTGHGPVEGFDPAMIQLGRKVVAEEGLATLVELQRGREDPLASPSFKRLCDTWPGYQAWGESKTLAASSDMWLAMSAEILGPADRLDSLAAIAAPTLVICGEEDSAFVEASRSMAKTITGARLAMIADAGHSPQFEAPGGWWRELAGFLDDVATAGRESGRSANPGRGR
jgi:pimeloyl-ACP methyl ester carboxylesterase